jgi:hypothetical protein
VGVCQFCDGNARCGQVRGRQRVGSHDSGWSADWIGTFQCVAVSVVASHASSLGQTCCVCFEVLLLLLQDGVWLRARPWHRPLVCLLGLLCPAGSGHQIPCNEGGFRMMIMGTLLCLWAA